MNRRGEQSEALAADFLSSQSLTITGRNYSCHFSEIDLIARKGDIVVFVEVRSRADSAFGSASATIPSRKRDKLLKALRHYLSV